MASDLDVFKLFAHREKEYRTGFWASLIAAIFGMGLLMTTILLLFVPTPNAAAIKDVTDEIIRLENVLSSLRMKQIDLKSQRDSAKRALDDAEAAEKKASDASKTAAERVVVLSRPPQSTATPHSTATQPSAARRSSPGALRPGLAPPDFPVTDPDSSSEFTDSPPLSSGSRSSSDSQSARKFGQLDTSQAQSEELDVPKLLAFLRNSESDPRRSDSDDEIDDITALQVSEVRRLPRELRSLLAPLGRRFHRTDDELSSWAVDVDDGPLGLELLDIAAGQMHPSRRRAIEMRFDNLLILFPAPEGHTKSPAEAIKEVNAALERGKREASAMQYVSQSAKLFFAKSEDWNELLKEIKDDYRLWAGEEHLLRPVATSLIDADQVDWDKVADSVEKIITEMFKGAPPPDPSAPAPAPAPAPKADRRPARGDQVVLATYSSECSLSVGYAIAGGENLNGVDDAPKPDESTSFRQRWQDDPSLRAAVHRELVRWMKSLKVPDKPKIAPEPALDPEAEFHLTYVRLKAALEGHRDRFRDLARSLIERRSYLEGDEEQLIRSVVFLQNALKNLSARIQQAKDTNPLRPGSALAIARQKKAAADDAVNAAAATKNAAADKLKAAETLKEQELEEIKKTESSLAREIESRREIRNRPSDKSTNTSLGSIVTAIGVAISQCVAGTIVLLTFRAQKILTEMTHSFATMQDQERRKKWLKEIDDPQLRQNVLADLIRAPKPS